MEQLIKQIEQWAEDRNIINGSKPIDQAMKLFSEFGELADNSWEAWQAAKAIADGFVVVNKKELAKVLNCVTDNWLIDTDSVEEFKKIESLVQDEIDEMFKAQDPANNVARELVNNDVTYVIELQGYEAIEHARVTLKKKGYKTWDYTDKDSIDDADIYVLCVCPSTPNDSALVKGTFKGIHQGKFTYIQSGLESCPDALEPAND